MTDKNEFIVFGAPSIQQDEIDEVVDSLATGWLGTGPKVAQFEKDFAEYKQTPFSIAVNSCSAALHLSLIASEVGPGDEVITTPMTFCATINAIIHVGATPVLADIEPNSLNIDPIEIEKKITSKTKAILLVHFAGRACNMDAIMGLAEQHNLKVIEDCAHAIETEYKGRKAGTFGDFGCFSFYVTKNVATGEGGMIVVKSEQYISRLKSLSLHGMSKDAWHRFSDEGYKHYYVVEAGFKYNMMDLQAALGIHQLRRVEQNWKVREKIWHRYQQAFESLPVDRPTPIEQGTRHGHHLYTLMIDKQRTGISRDRFLELMTHEGIGLGVHYLSIPEHPFYKQTYHWQPEDYPHAMKVGREIISLPISAKLTESDIERIINAVKKFIRLE